MENLSIAGSFCIKNGHFLLVNVSSGSQTERFEDNNNDENSNIHSTLHTEVGHFENDGETYLILKSKTRLKGYDEKLTNMLTGRELQIVTLVALGYCNKQISNQLGISEWTVSAHMRRIFSKLSVDSRAAMVYRCASLINQLLELFQPEENLRGEKSQEDFVDDLKGFDWQAFLR